jgi:hypothetical protein
MKIKFKQGALNALGNQIAAQVEQAFNHGIKLAKGQPLDQAVRTVAQEMKSAGVDPNLDGIREKLTELGWV